MALSRTTRISILLVIDAVFLVIELSVGFAVGSLALVSDAFHMLNDVMSLAVALYAIRMTKQSVTDSRFSYGWHRAEILAALVNGVFLLALCFSISLEAIERFFSQPEISNPKLVVVVGSLGLASNVVGLILFHEHSHSHGDHSHSTPPSPRLGQSRTPTSPDKAQSRPSSPSLYGHPAATRASLVQTANDMASGRPMSPQHHRSSSKVTSPVETEPRASGTFDSIEETELDLHLSEATSLLDNRAPLTPAAASHSGHGGHSHAGSMNMRALVLHVLGDFLGNVGVIATGLIIWLTDWSFKSYCDPLISLVITAIIFSSAMPLVRSASFILLQGVPPSVSLDEVRDAILEVEGVISLHELHIWQLSESKLIASVHVIASRSHDFMPVASKIRNALHERGIHSSTIQPEYAGAAQPGEYMLSHDDTSCLILCPADMDCQELSCCPPGAHPVAV